MYDLYGTLYQNMINLVGKPGMIIVYEQLLLSLTTFGYGSERNPWNKPKLYSPAPNLMQRFSARNWNEQQKSAPFWTIDKK